MNELDNLPDGYYWGLTKKYGVLRMLRKSTDRQSWGEPWKDMEDGKRATWAKIRERYSELTPIVKPVFTGN